jgi:hypothetical protein
MSRTNYLRLMFEPGKGVDCNHTGMAKHYFLSYLSDFDPHVEFTGVVSFSGTLRRDDAKFEPLWQCHIWEITESVKLAVLEYLDSNPIEGYYIHVQEHNDNFNGREKLIRSSR